MAGNRTDRRGFLTRFALAVAGVLTGKKAFGKPNESDAGLVTEGEILRTSVFKGRPPLEPLDTMIRFERSDNNTGRAMTHEILSLMHEEKGNNSYPWTIYAHLTTHHVNGDACVLCSRLTKKGVGWSTGLHSEVFNYAGGVALGANIEMTNEYSGSEASQVIGLNIQILAGQPCQYGLQVHGPGVVEKSIGLNGKGRVGLDLGGEFEIGINAHSNSIRLDEGAAIELESSGRIKIRYLKGRIEFMNGDRCVGHIDVDGADHEL
ncbi:MAG: hypothetical protein QHI38_05210 [Armatimonadota bacterium]|nr:hypothetical protein [Armatimonadota bacterium]